MVAKVGNRLLRLPEMVAKVEQLVAKVGNRLIRLMEMVAKGQGIGC